MQSLNQARRKSGNAGAPIPMPIGRLKENGVHIRRGQVTMIAAAPGGGKTALTHALLHHGDGHGNVSKVLYWSADSGPETIWERAASLSTRLDSDAVRRRVAEGRTAELDAAIAVRGGHIQFDFTGYLSQEHMERELSAYLELHGEYPEVLVVDNHKNAVDPQDPDEVRAGEDAIVYLNTLSRDTGAAVIVLSHVTGFHEDGALPIPLSGIRNKLSKTPSLILTLHRPHDGEVRVSVVKSRGTKADASGKFWVSLKVDLSRMLFEG